MECARYRQAASARLDNEPLGISALALNRHLLDCSACASWLEKATQLGRGLRVSSRTAPDLSAQILADVSLPGPRIARRRRWLRVALALLGLVQWALAMPALVGQQMYMQMSEHASHESAAWNLAVGAAFVAVAIRPARAGGTVPILATFVGVLTVLSLPDLADGAVGAARLASHAGIAIGLVLVLMMERSQRLLPSRGAFNSAEADDGQLAVPQPGRLGRTGRLGRPGRPRDRGAA